MIIVIKTDSINIQKDAADLVFDSDITPELMHWITSDSSNQVLIIKGKDDEFKYKDLAYLDVIVYPSDTYLRMCDIVSLLYSKSYSDSQLMDAEYGYTQALCDMRGFNTREIEWTRVLDQLVSHQHKLCAEIQYANDKLQSANIK